MRRSLVAPVIALVLAALAPTAASAQPAGVFGGCPRGQLLSVDDTGVTREAAPALRCEPLIVRGGKIRGEPRCLEPDGFPEPVLVAAPEVTHRFIREKGKPWTLIAFHAGRRRIALWRTNQPVDCVGRIFISPDRRTIAAEITFSKKFELDERHARRMVAFRLARPLPPVTSPRDATR